mgnify:CR=1 FL=1
MKNVLSTYFSRAGDSGEQILSAKDVSKEVGICDLVISNYNNTQPTPAKLMGDIYTELVRAKSVNFGDDPKSIWLVSL